MLGDSVAIDAAAVVVGIVLTTSKTEFITTVNRTDGSAAVAAVAVAKAAWWAKKLEILHMYVFFAMNVSTQRERESVARFVSFWKVLSTKSCPNNWRLFQNVTIYIIKNCYSLGDFKKWDIFIPSSVANLINILRS